MFTRPKIKFNKLDEHAKLPIRAHPTDTGYDVYSLEDVTLYSKVAHYTIIKTGLSIGYITPGYWLRIEGRSGLAIKRLIFPFNGIIDENFSGEIRILLMNLGENTVHIDAGDRIAQLVPYKRIEMTMSFTTEKRNTDRGESGFGASGK